MLDSPAPTTGKFEFRPLEPGYALTLGNALRRVLLSSLEGFAISSIKIGGVDHEFASLKGVVEDVVVIILNLKQIRFKRLVRDAESETIKLTISNETEFRAGMLSKALNSFKVLNPDHVICHMEHNVRLSIELTIKKGRGYVPAEANREDLIREHEGKLDARVIAIDSIHTPIKNVNHWMEPYRVEERTDYEKLNLEITTDGSIEPGDALKEAAKILIYHFVLFADDQMKVDVKSVTENVEFDEEMLRMRQLLKTKLTDLDLSVRALNCLKTADMITLADLVKYHRNDLLKVRNFGRKSLTELDDKLVQLNLAFGMNIALYHLDEPEEEEVVAAAAAAANAADEASDTADTADTAIIDDDDDDDVEEAAAEEEVVENEAATEEAKPKTRRRKSAN
jgi:DNA-directed RNA polymerase subunit alpha